ncbi:MAG: hypothetical protein V1835_00070 [Candidatus Micrarchaeota archaeon]
MHKANRVSDSGAFVENGCAGWMGHENRRIDCKWMGKADYVRGCVENVRKR